MGKVTQKCTKVTVMLLAVDPFDHESVRARHNVIDVSGVFVFAIIVTRRPYAQMVMRGM
ncbi:hypothetical protein GTO27_02090 [Candidatus Bathyarchaeota archaeon]|nr:hypothetical protein [Candidatus Bathyarchaeota archaeon]